MNILTIDTTDNKEVIVSLTVSGKETTKKEPLDTRKGQVVLPLVEELLQENGLHLSDLSAIQVNPGPGSFTGIRVGLSIANTLGLLLNIPVNGKKADFSIEPIYS